MKFTIDRIDHVVLTCADIELTAAWYERVLGMEREEFGADRRIALRFGAQKINLHEVAAPFEPHALTPATGGLDICFITAVGPDDVMAHLNRLGVEIIEGPVQRTGALGAMRSVYCRDPDGNLVEIASYLEH